MSKPKPKPADWVREWLDATGLKHSPDWKDAEDVAALFDDEENREWSSVWPWLDDEPKAETSDPSAKRKRGQRGPMRKMDRVRRWPIHRAASTVHLVERVLRDLYPDQRREKIHDRALLVVDRWWQRDGHTDITDEKLENYLHRRKCDRRRLT